MSQTVLPRVFDTSDPNAARPYSQCWSPFKNFRNRLLVLLCHKLQRERPFVFAPQHGQRERMATSFAISRRRKVEIELGTWRAGRNGGASGSVTFGKGKLQEENFGNRS